MRIVNLFFGHLTNAEFHYNIYGFSELWIDAFIKVKVR